MGSGGVKMYFVDCEGGGWPRQSCHIKMKIMKAVIGDSGNNATGPHHHHINNGYSLIVTSVPYSHYHYISKYTNFSHEWTTKVTLSTHFPIKLSLTHCQFTTTNI